MNEMKRTIIFVAVAVLSVGAASATYYAHLPKRDADTTGLATDFYPEFQDPTAAQVLQVVAYNKDSASVKDFKVEYRDGKWRIPSHHNYPADAKDRLAKTAASVIGTKRDALVTRRKSDQAQYDVVDPEDPDAAVLTGRGQKIILSKNDGTILADYIIGKKLPGQTDAYYVRAPKTTDPDSVYIAKLKIDLSTKFSDWIEPDLLKVDRDNLGQIDIDNYSIDETQGVLVPGQKSELTRKNSSDAWKLNGLKADEEVNTETVNRLVSSLDGLRIVGVRPKPQGVKPDLSLDPRVAGARDLVFALRNDMANRGFYIASDRRGGKTKLVSKEGELDAGTNEGVRYALHFGQIFTGSEFEIETGLSKDPEKKDIKPDAAKKGAGDDKNKDSLKKSRYLMVYTTFDSKLAGPAPVKPSEPKKPAGLVLGAPSDSKNKPTASPAPKSPSDSKASVPTTDKNGKKQSATGSLHRNKIGEDNMLALASADPKDAKPTPAQTEKAAAKPPASPTAKAPPKSPTKSPTAAPPKPAAAAPPAAPDPKSEYEKAMAQYKKDLEKFDNDNAEYAKKLKKGEDKVKQLNERFGPWYYVISAESFENLRLARTSLVKPKEKPGDKKDAAGAGEITPSFPK